MRPANIGPLCPVPSYRSFQRVGMDILGPFKKSGMGNTNIIVLIDYFTKFAETKAVPNANAQAVADFFVHQIALRHVASEYLMTDFAKWYVNKLMKAVCGLLETNFQVSSPYHPQTNGQVEKLNRTLTDMLSMYSDTEHLHWAEPLPYVTYAYNSARQEATQYSPYFLVHGKETCMPLDVSLGAEPNSEEWVSHQTPGILHKELIKARKWVAERLPAKTHVSLVKPFKMRLRSEEQEEQEEEQAERSGANTQDSVDDNGRPLVTTPASEEGDPHGELTEMGNGDAEGQRELYTPIPPAPPLELSKDSESLSE